MLLIERCERHKEKRVIIKIDALDKVRTSVKGHAQLVQNNTQVGYEVTETHGKTISGSYKFVRVQKACIWAVQRNVNNDVTQK